MGALGIAPPEHFPVLYIYHLEVSPNCVTAKTHPDESRYLAHLLSDESRN